MKKRSNLPFKIGSWISDPTVEDEIVISSRVRLARNLEDYTFPSWLKDEESKTVNKIIIDVINNDPRLKKLRVYKLEDLSKLDKQILFEKYLVSSNFLEENSLERSVVLSNDAHLGIMINEEDHLRLQAVFSGLQLIKAWKVASEVDDQISLHLKYAFSEKWGYLTACPTNIGTALRASVMIHLPALILNNQVEQMVNTFNQLGIVFRGLFGEGSIGIGNIFQVSNQTTLGSKEEEIIENLNCLCIQLIEKEKTARKLLLRDSKLKVSDRANRAVGILTHAEILGFEESLELLSMIRLGLDLGLTKGLDRKKINELFFRIRPGHIKLEAEKDLTKDEIKIKRAELVKKILNL